MKINTNEIRSGNHDGKIVWICHYNRPDLNKKALRNLPPTKVLVRSNSELPKNKKVYYSLSHFSPLKKNGKPSTKAISPVDNTGYRSYCGNMLHVFENEEECCHKWNAQIVECCSRFDIKIDNILEILVLERDNLAKCLRFSDDF